ncbi:hypothetical protein KR009_010339, partial [Drosophila setifemur]
QNSLRFLLLLGLLVVSQGRNVDQVQETASQENVANPEVVSSPETIKPVEVKPEVIVGNPTPVVKSEVIPENPSGKSEANPSPVVNPTPVLQENPSVNPEVSNEISKEQEPIKESKTPQVEEQNSIKEAIIPQVKEQNSIKEKVIPQVEEQNSIKAEENPQENPAQVQGRDNKYEYDPSLQYGIPDIEKIFKYPGGQYYNGSQYQNQYNKFNKYPNYPEYVNVVNTTGANVTHHIHNHTHYYPNQKKPGFPFPFLPNPFEKQDTTYVYLNETSSGNVTTHTHIHEESKPFPFLPNPFTDFPKVVGLSLVLLPNPFFKNKSQGEGSQDGVNYEYYGKFRGFSGEEPQKQQNTGFYLIPNPLGNLGNQGSTDGKVNKGGDSNVLLPVNLAALPLLVPAPEFHQGKASASSSVPSGTIKLEDLIKATNVHVSQPLKLQANNGLSQIQKEQAAIQQLILSQLSQQQKLFQKQTLKDEKRSQSSQAVQPEEEESSVLFAVEIPKPIYRFFKGIFGGFSK